MSDVSLRSRVLRAHGAGAAETQELLDYNANHFSQVTSQVPKFPLDDEPFVSTWTEYQRRAPAGGVFDFLAARMPQLRFPIQAGISQSESYLSAVRRGARVEGDGLVLRRAGDLALFVHPSAAGKLPVLFTPDRDDFVSLVQALTARNEPVAVPKSMGACIVSGYNNWDRIHTLRRDWEEQIGVVGADARWSTQFEQIARQKQLYQDTFVIVSGGPYSAVPAGDLQLSEEEWLRHSFEIRLEHESAHYFTRRVFGSMRNSPLDELLADRCGIVASQGCFRASWFLRFVGLEDFPLYREGGRLENYRGVPALSDAAFRVLQSVLKTAAESLEQFGKDGTWLSDPDSPLILMALCTLTLEELASSEFPERMLGALEDLRCRAGVAAAAARPQGG